MTRPIDLGELFDQAVAYHYASKIVRLREDILLPSILTEARDEHEIPLSIVNKPWVRELTFVSGTMIAFSAELYLKGLCLMYKIEPPREHSLLRLFSLLPDSIQDSIKGFNTIDMQFDEVLKYAQLNFLELRYMKLQPDKGYVMAASIVADTLHNYLLTVLPNPARYEFAEQKLPSESEWQNIHRKQFL